MKTPKCPIVFSARDFGTLTTHQAITVSEAARVANALAAAQWQAYVEGLTEVTKFDGCENRKLRAELAELERDLRIKSIALKDLGEDYIKMQSTLQYTKKALEDVVMETNHEFAKSYAQETLDKIKQE